MCKMFAYDTYLILKVLGIKESGTQLNTDWEKLSQWTYKQKIQFNLYLKEEANEVISLVN